MNEYTRCTYIQQDTKEQCTSHFENDDPKQTLCPIHAETISCKNATQHDEVKAKYLELVNQEHQLCVNMTNDELDEHILRIESHIENERTKLLAARATRADKLSKLSDEERATYRTEKITKAVRKKNKVVLNADDKEETKKPKLTLKANPIQYMMHTYHMTEEQAKQSLGL